MKTSELISALQAEAKRSGERTGEPDPEVLVSIDEGMRVAEIEPYRPGDVGRTVEWDDDPRSAIYIAVE